MSPLIKFTDMRYFLGDKSWFWFSYSSEADVEL